MSNPVYQIMLPELDSKYGENGVSIGFPRGVYNSITYNDITKAMGMDPMGDLRKLTRTTFYQAQKSLQEKYSNYETAFKPMMDTIELWVTQKSDMANYFKEITDEIQNLRDSCDSQLSSIVHVFSIKPDEQAGIEESDLLLDFLNTVTANLAGFVPAVNAFQQSLLFIVRSGSGRPVHGGYTPIQNENHLHLSAAGLHDSLNDKFLSLLYEKDRLFENACKSKTLLDYFSSLTPPSAGRRNEMRRALQEAFKLTCWSKLLPQFAKIQKAGELAFYPQGNHSEDDILESCRRNAIDKIKLDGNGKHIATVGLLIHRETSGRVIAPVYTYKVYLLELVLGHKDQKDQQFPAEVLDKVIGDAGAWGTKKFSRKTVLMGKRGSLQPIKRDLGRLYRPADGAEGARYFVYPIRIQPDNVSVFSGEQLRQLNPD
ncbi:hypothetical protein DU002_14230 [Corallincola holothuriorum]|uniref:Uncharacterized protein n=1 Tax=Corallincola holothuriorum TaxID=2282215 RepID=A0A368N8M9_9GAMM|nr:hypothetical protein [Corallincola holothuriorum]RCU45619.1 hypothetical protein DU002_14230 [Corallincola holothuriorum]